MYSKEEKTTLIGLGMPTIFLRFSKALVMLVFFYYALNFTNNEFLIGVAFGITALIQAGLTIPFGFWSDKYGRKKMIIIGLLFFIIGSLLAAHPFNNIIILIFARALQGISAIYSCVLAFISDVIPDNKRSRTLGIFSIFTGIVFSIGIILGPTIAPTLLPYSYLFLLSAILAGIALIYFIIFVPETKIKDRQKEKHSSINIFKDAFANRKLLWLYIITFLSNLVLVSILFLMAPLMLEDYIPKEYTGLLLIPIFIIGMIVMLFTSKFADRGSRVKVGISGLILVGFGLVLFFISNFIVLIFGLTLFFVGMAILDPLLPSLIMNQASKKSKGTASGVYNLTRYLGEGIGPVMAGFILFVSSNLILLIFLFMSVIISMFLIGGLATGRSNN
jgi:MFS family permease